MAGRITDLALAATLTGNELLEASQLDTAVDISAATISAVAADNSYNDSATGFITSGFAVGNRINVSGFTGNAANNILVGTITALTAGKMTIGGVDGNVIVDDAAGETVVITKWVSRRVPASLLGGGVIDALSWKAGVRAASTANGVLATAYENGDSLDGVTLVTGDRILLKNQSAGAENGIYVVNASGAPTRASDANTGAEVVNATVAVSEGSAPNADKVFICTTNAPITLGTTALVFGELGASTGLGAGSTTDQLTGTSAAVASTPDSVAALWEQGSDVASAATISLGEGGYFNITGTVTITDIDFATDKAGRRAWLKFAGILTLTNGASLILPTGANIVTAAGDCAEFVSEGADVVRCVAYTRANGQALAAAGGTGLPFELVVACSDETTALTVGAAKITFRMPRAVTLTAVRASLVTAQTSGTIFTVDINEAGASILSTKLTIDNTEKTSTTAATAPVISDAALADDAEITIDIDQIGDSTAKGLKVTLIGTRT